MNPETDHQKTIDIWEKAELHARSTNPGRSKNNSEFIQC